MDLNSGDGHVWIEVDAALPKACLGTVITVPVDDGKTWLDLGKITAGEIAEDGSVRYAIRLAKGIVLPEEWIDATNREKSRLD